jgi:hypothetical protein
VNVVSMLLDVLTLVAVLLLVSVVGVLLRRPRRGRSTEQDTVDLQRNDHLGGDEMRRSGGMLNGPGGV